MRISTQTDIIFPAFGIDEGMKIFKEAGFDALDFSMFYMNSSFGSRAVSELPFRQRGIQ